MKHASSISALSAQSVHLLPRHELMSCLEEVVTTGWKGTFYRKHWGIRRLEDALGLIRSGEFHHLPVIRKHHLRDHWEQLMQFEDAVDRNKHLALLLQKGQMHTYTFSSSLNHACRNSPLWHTSKVIP